MRWVHREDEERAMITTMMTVREGRKGIDGNLLKLKKRGWQGVELLWNIYKIVHTWSLKFTSSRRQCTSKDFHPRERRWENDGMLQNDEVVIIANVSLINQCTFPLIMMILFYPSQRSWYCHSLHFFLLLLLFISNTYTQWMNALWRRKIVDIFCALWNVVNEVAMKITLKNEEWIMRI